MSGFATVFRMQQPTGSSDFGQCEHFFRNLNAVRLLIVVMISFGYASTMSINPYAPELLRLFGYDPSWYGLQLLFCLSGWLAWKSLSEGRSLKTFLMNRARRTLPWVAFYTACVVAILYPLFCDPSAPVELNAASLALYFFKTITLIDPGGPMPGALDGAAYMCLFQGTIWTLRWGAIAYIGLIIFWTLGFRSRYAIASLFLAALTIHIASSAWALNTGSNLFEPFSAGLRLAYAFTFGATLQAFRNSLPKTGKGWFLMSVTLLLFAGAQYYLLPWTHFIEVTATMGLSALALSLLHSEGLGLSRWPNLVLPTYLGIWPITQTILALHPDISVPMLILTSLSAAISLAYALVSLSGLTRRGFHRRVQTA